MKSKFLFIVGLFCGILTLTVGILIFISWWIGRAFFAIDLNDLEVLGLLWTLISLLIAGFGLILMIIVFWRNFPKYSKKTLLGILIILLNLPILYGILSLQTEIDKRAYVKIYNHTKHDNVELILKGADFEKRLGIIDDGESLVDFFYPQYIDPLIDDSYPKMMEVVLIVKTEKSTHRLILPVYKGECDKLYIDKNFRLRDKW
jgi:hypothetical protein